MIIPQLRIYFFNHAFNIFPPSLLLFLPLPLQLTFLCFFCFKHLCYTITGKFITWILFPYFKQDHWFTYQFLNINNGSMIDIQPFYYDEFPHHFCFLRILQETRKYNLLLTSLKLHLHFLLMFGSCCNVFHTLYWYVLILIWNVLC